VKKGKRGINAERSWVSDQELRSPNQWGNRGSAIGEGPRRVAQTKDTPEIQKESETSEIDIRPWGKKGWSPEFAVMGGRRAKNTNQPVSKNCKVRVEKGFREGGGNGFRQFRSWRHENEEAIAEPRNLSHGRSTEKTFAAK